MSPTKTVSLLIAICMLGAYVYADDVLSFGEKDRIVNLFDTVKHRSGKHEDKDRIINLYDTAKYRSCDEVRNEGPYNESGVYNIFPDTTEPLWVFCRFEGLTATTSIMGQKTGNVNFYRDWYDYKYGFGSATQGDYWVGLATMKKVADAGSRVLTIQMQDWNHAIKTIRYHYFNLDTESQRYRLTVSGYQGSIPDDLSFNNGMYFATYDRPDARNCANNQKGGWWYNYCTYMLPTGHYYIGGHYTPSGSFYDGIFYNDWEGYGYSLKYIRMDLSVN